MIGFTVSQRVFLDIIEVTSLDSSYTKDKHSFSLNNPFAPKWHQRKNKAAQKASWVSSQEWSV